MQPNWAKVLGEMLAEHELADRKQIEVMMARIVALEARPVEKGDAGELSAELVEQINSMKQMLLELLPVATPVASLEVDPPELRHLTGTIITRDGHLAAFYSDGTSELLGSVIGPQGPAGPAGPSGRDGVDGAKGDEGRRGRDGASVTAITKNGRKLLFALSDGQLFTVADGDEKKRT